MRKAVYLAERLLAVSDDRTNFLSDEGEEARSVTSKSGK